MTHEFLGQLETFSKFWLKHQYVLPQESLMQGIRLLSTAPDEFRKKHSYYHLTKILNAFCQFEKKVKPPRRGIFFRLLKPNRSINNVLGIAAVLNINSESEFFSKKQLFRTLLRIVPGISKVEGTFYQYRDHEKGILFLYQEIEKKRGRGFSNSDIQELKRSLAKEIEENIECLSPSLFFIRNEEEIYRNIVQMGRELDSSKDMPQVTISFQKQINNGCLRFSVVIVRLIKENTPSLKKLSIALPKTIKFLIEMTTLIGSINKKITKEANILTFDVESTLFARKNGAIDLREARAYVAKAIELMIGEYRDYNGGLFSKQNKQLKEIQAILEDKNKTLIESLFYSFTPSLFQTFILPEAAQACTSLFLEAIDHELTHPYLLLKKNEEKFSLMVIKTGREHLKNALVRKCINFSSPLHHFGYVVQFIEGYYYLGLIYQYPSNRQCLDTFEEILEHAHEKPLTDKKILRINFQDGDPLSLNPQLGLDLRCRSLQKALFEGLTRINPEGIAELAAAKAVEISPSGLDFFFSLKKLQWSNGEELTAFHFERTWKNAIKSASCLRPDLFYIIRNARKARFSKANLDEIGVKALDKQTLKVSLEVPSPYFLELLAHPMFFPLYEEHGEPYVFSGPFSLHSWQRDHSLILIKNPYYWDCENVKLDGIEISIIRDPTLAFDKYNKGEIDWIGGPFSLLPHSIALSLKEKLKKIDTSGIAWLYCNINQPFLSSPKIRRALSYSLNRDKIGSEVLINQIPCKTILPIGISLLDQNEVIQECDPQTLFAQGLEEIKLSKNTFSLLSLVHSHIPGQKELACEILDQWQHTLGIKIERIESTWNTFSHQLDNRLFHFGACYRHPFYTNPFYFFNIFYESTNIHNAFGWQGETFNNWIDRARQNPNDKSFLKRAEQELLTQMPVIPLHMVSYDYLSHDELCGIHFCHSGDVDFRWIYFKEK